MIISSTDRIMIQNMILESFQLSNRGNTSISVTKLDDSHYFQFLFEFDISEIENRIFAEVIEENRVNN